MGVWHQDKVAYSSTRLRFSLMQKYDDPQNTKKNNKQLRTKIAFNAAKLQMMILRLESWAF